MEDLQAHSTWKEVILTIDVFQEEATCAAKDWIKGLLACERGPADDESGLTFDKAIHSRLQGNWQAALHRPLLQIASYLQGKRRMPVKTQKF